MLYIVAQHLLLGFRPTVFVGEKDTTTGDVKPQGVFFFLYTQLLLRPPSSSYRQRATQPDTNWPFSLRGPSDTKWGFVALTITPKSKGVRP